MTTINSITGQTIQVISQKEFSQRNTEKEKVSKNESHSRPKTGAPQVRNDTVKFNDSIELAPSLTYSKNKLLNTQLPEPTPDTKTPPQPENTDQAYQFRPADILDLIDCLNQCNQSEGVDVNRDGVVNPRDLLAWIDAANASQQENSES